MKCYFSASMRFVIIIFILSNLWPVLGQGFNNRYDAFAWGNAQGSFGIEYGETGYTIIGWSYDIDSLAPDLFLTHSSILFTFIDLAGIRVDEKRMYRPLHGTFPGWANCSDTIPGGGYIVGGGSEAIDGSDEIYLMRFNEDGDTLWTSVFGDPTLNNYWGGYQVKSDGGFIVVGITDDPGLMNAFALKTDQLGNEQWWQTYGGPQISAHVSIDHAPNGGWFCGGHKNISTTNRNFWVIQIDAEGELQWQVNWGCEFDEPSAQLTTLSDGNIFIASGWGYAPGGTSLAPYLAKLDGSNGDIIWDNE